MIKSGLAKVIPDHKDYSILDTFKDHPVFGGVIADPTTLPDNFSIYDGREIPNQNADDTRFSFLIPPLPYGCTGETGAFDCGLQDNAVYNPQDLYLNTPPGGDGGRDIRSMLQTLIDRGPRLPDGTFGPKRLAYFNCYGSGKIDDFDAARIGLWINQQEKRGIYLGTFWYPEFENPDANGSLPMPTSFDMSIASLHCHLGVGWRVLNGVEEIQDLSWQGTDYANAGVDWIPRDLYNALMAQPYTGAFTATKMPSNTPIPIGYQAEIDHLVAYIRQLFSV